MTSLPTKNPIAEYLEANRFSHVISALDAGVIVEPMAQLIASLRENELFVDQNDSPVLLVWGEAFQYINSLRGWVVFVKKLLPNAETCFVERIREGLQKNTPEIQESDLRSLEKLAAMLLCKLIGMPYRDVESMISTAEYEISTY